ncbi:ATP-dependent helicase [Bradyrhizobium septentrionale]|uniref:ATP-dependent helicase n=1 Tax=Bradyrhizobium septentrionale TaxID=1404411 RepID=UPI001596E75A|nr:ATP-dependent helicase [Bradyrhizobium septentrionale]UGY28871.1 ATP-dependent helicase [Bradyrhizobium septentrionale]
MQNQNENASPLDRLNPRQREAVAFGVEVGKATQHPPLLIIAGAGVGKTRVLATRTANLLASGARSSEMFVASFTRRASKELVERVQNAVKEVTGKTAVQLPYAGTFHSIGYNLLNEFGEHVGLQNNFTVLDRDDAVDLMDLVRARSGKDKKEKAFPQKDVCSNIHSYTRNACLSLKATLRERYPHLRRHRKALAKVFADYTAAKKSQNVVDYDDLLMLVADLLRHPKMGDQLRSRFKYVLIDEFQDTSRLQFEIIRLLRPTGRGLTVVGDDAQAIYSFRAATVKNIQEFPDSFVSEAKIVSLTRNYRSTEPILEASNAVISRAVGGFKKELWSKRKSDQRPLLITVTDEIEQANHVVGAVLDLREQGVPFAQQAVLFRASQHSLALEVALLRAKIPFRKWGGTKFLEAAHIKDVLAVLKWSQNPRLQLAGFRVLKLLDGVGTATANRLVQELAGKRLTKRLAHVTVPQAARKQWSALSRLLNGLAESGWPASLEKTVAWYRPHLERLYDDSAESRRADLDQLVALGATFGSCEQFLAELALDPPGVLAEQKLSKENADDLLTLSTIHSAKGCEWKCVTVLSVMDGCIPSSKCRREDDFEEERRLLYVAMTRAKDRLEIILPRRHFQPFKKNVPAANVYSKPSRFLPREIHGRFEQRTASIRRSEPT